MKYYKSNNSIIKNLLDEIESNGIKIYETDVDTKGFAMKVGTSSAIFINPRKIESTSLTIDLLKHEFNHIQKGLFYSLEDVGTGIQKDVEERIHNLKEETK